MAQVKRVVEYKLRLNDNNQKVIPPHIIDGGYYPRQDGRMIGILCVDDDVYISPNEFAEISEQELTDRITNLRENATGEPPLGQLSVEDEVAWFMTKLA